MSANDEEKRVGLCVTCRHVKRIASDRGPTYYMCRLSVTDDRFAQYPRLPVLKCSGYERLSSDDEGRSTK